jgi:tRNA(Ile)-lysidine synthetase-like protein
VPRAALHRALAGAPAPVDDPTNRDPARPRNRLRHRLLPALAGRDSELPARLAALAAAAAGAAAAVERRLAALLAPRPFALPGGGVGLAVERAALAALPAPLVPAALALLHRRAGAPYPAGRAGRGELLRQLAGGGGVGCDCGGGWRWRTEGSSLVLAHRPSRRRRREAAPPFTYTLVAPGELEIPELSLRFRLARGPVEGWMFRGDRRRAGLALPLGPGEAVTVRSRRPGDRLRPLGAPGERRLKEVLIDRRVPRGERDRLPLLCLGAGGPRVAWVPGVTIDERYRLRRADATVAGGAWVAAVEPLESGTGRDRWGE